MKAPRYVILSRNPQTSIVSLIHADDTTFGKRQANQMVRIANVTGGYEGHKFAIVSVKRFKEVTDLTTLVP